MTVEPHIFAKVRVVDAHMHPYIPSGYHNGDVGVITAINPTTRGAWVQFPTNHNRYYLFRHEFEVIDD